MADKTPPSDPSAVVSAGDLRMTVLRQQLEKAERQDKLRALEEKRLSEFAEDFLKNHVSDEERAMIRRIVMNAVKDGKFEALVYSFPSELCTDQGRAINSNDPAWPDTLQGKAREFYERFKAVAQPQGYKMKAMIINFPGGMPGDVGFFLNWAPDEV